MSRRPFITFEGSEGCGKSTQVQRLAARLESLGVPFLLTREPGGTFIGDQIRQLLQYTPQAANMTAETELLLFAASRAQLVRELIQPALARGQCVVSDRFFDSTSVYQGVARRLDAGMVEQLNRFAVGECLPDLTFILDVDLAVARRRMLRRVRSTVDDRMEQEPLSFYEEVGAAYRSLAASDPHRFRLIDGNRAIEEIETEIWTELSTRFPSLVSAPQST
jgi:dTMP kinase